MEKPPWRCHGRACRGLALGRCRCVWGVLVASRFISHIVQSDSLLQADVAFSLLLLLLQLEGLQDLLPTAGGGPGLVDVVALEAAHMLTVDLSVHGFMYLFRMAKTSLFKIWYFLILSAIFFRGWRRTGARWLGVGGGDREINSKGRTV